MYDVKSELWLKSVMSKNFGISHMNQLYSTAFAILFQSKELTAALVTFPTFSSNFAYSVSCHRTVALSALLVHWAQLKMHSGEKSNI